MSCANGFYLPHATCVKQCIPLKLNILISFAFFLLVVIPYYFTLPILVFLRLLLTHVF